MTEELKHKLADIQPIIAMKSSFTGAEAAKIFALYNEITGETRAVTSCSSCVNTVVTRLKKECRNAGL